jgi:hypothetical protein
MRRLLFTLAAAIAVLTGTLSSAHATTAVTTTSSGPHVWVLVLENKTYNETFGPTSEAPYLSKTLTSQGVLLRNYYGTGHLSLDNYVSMMSGQAPNAQTQGDCLTYSDFVSPNGGALDSNGQVLGHGCVYPKTALTLADQLDAKHLSWKGYMENMGTPCRHPALNSQDDTQKARSDGDQYAARHNPFVYFHSIIDDPARCNAHVVDLAKMTTDMAKVETTPRFSFITPNLCNDGHDSPCISGWRGGLVAADYFLRKWVPRITSSPAFQQDGILIVAFDEAEASGSSADATACCNEKSGPNTTMPGISGPGGGRMGAVILSRYVKPGSVTDEGYNHYSLLRSLEDLYAVPYLGFAGQAGLQAFSTDVYASDPTP